MGVGNPHDLERAVPKLRLVESVSFLTMPELARRGLTGVFQPALYALLSPLPFYRNLVRHLRYAFGVAARVAAPGA